MGEIFVAMMFDATTKVNHECDMKFNHCEMIHHDYYSPIKLICQLNVIFLLSATVPCCMTDSEGPAECKETIP